MARASLRRPNPRWSYSKVEPGAGKADRMTRTRWDAGTPPALPEALDLESPRQILKAYYSGARLESPNGGFLEPLGVRHASDGKSIAFFECSASSLRYQLPIPKATRTERKKVRDQQSLGEDPDCPRHGTGQRLKRVGQHLVCALCGVAFGKA